MFAVRGIYDGKRVKISEPVNKNNKYRVVVTFLEELPDDEQEIREFSAQTESFDFWENTAEDIYQDYIPQKKDKK
jgi:O-succinylbenzoate synthase